MSDIQDAIRYMQEAFLEAHRNAVKVFFDSLPNHVGPNQNQLNILQVITERTGIDVVQCKGSMFNLLGPRMHGTEGVFCYAKFDPRLRRDAIVLNLDARSAYWFSALFHELTHATGTTRHLNRPGVAERHRADILEVCFEELVAESVARRIMDRLGLATEETRDKSAKYIESYAANMQYLIDTDRLQSECDKAERLVLEWIDGIDFASQNILKAA